LNLSLDARDTRLTGHCASASNRKDKIMTFASQSLIAASLAATLMSAFTLNDAMAGKGSASRTLASRGGGSSHAQPGDTCLGASACNGLIAECAGEGLDFKIKQINSEGEPIYGHCVKAWD
jgi:hypothetical protein